MRAFAPMPLRRLREPFDDSRWLFEVKHDGFRGIAHVERGAARLLSRNGHQFEQFDGIRAELVRIFGKRRVVLDGEIVCLGDDGRPVFDALFYRRDDPYFYAFDLLALDGDDLRRLPLVERKRQLRALLGRRRGRVRYLSHVRSRGIALFTLICERDLEGIIAKHGNGLYDADVTTWWKIKNVNYSQARDRHELFEGRRAASGRR